MGIPDCNCIVRDPGDYPWHDAGFRPPAFSDLIIYQFHIGVFYAQGLPRAPISGRIASAKSSMWWTGSNTLRISA